MKTINLYNSKTTIFNKASRFAFKRSNGNLIKFLAYPEKRVEIPLDGFLTKDIEIVQGGYKWWANPSHLIYDCLSDFILIQELNPNCKISIRAHGLGLALINLLGGTVVEGSDVLDVGDDLSANGMCCYVENKWRFQGLQHSFITNKVGSIFSKRVDDMSTDDRYVIIKRKVPVTTNSGYFRNIKNIEELTEKLIKNTGFKFEVVQLEDLNIKDQINIFKAAKIIISTHGSGLVWLNFCKPGTIVVELITPYFIKNEIIKPDFWFISQALGLIHIPYVISQENIIGEINHHNNLEVSLESSEIEELIGQYI